MSLLVNIKCSADKATNIGSRGIDRLTIPREHIINVNTILGVLWRRLMRYSGKIKSPGPCHADVIVIFNDGTLI